MFLSFLSFWSLLQSLCIALFVFPCAISVFLCRYNFPKTLRPHSCSLLTSCKLWFSRLKRGALSAPHSNNVAPGFSSFLPMLQERYLLLLFIVIFHSSLLRTFPECLTTSIFFSPLHRHNFFFNKKDKHRVFVNSKAFQKRALHFNLSPSHQRKHSKLEGRSPCLSS